MKNKLKELDVDFIGEQEPITKEEGCKQTEGQKKQLRKKFINLFYGSYVA